jgi:hypothetical protein
MPQFYMFKCAGCQKEVTGPEVPTVETGGPVVGYSYKKRDGLECPNPWHNDFVYTGKQNRPPKAPAIKPVAVNPNASLPKAWVSDGEGGFTKSLKYPNIPAAAQKSLIAELEEKLGGPKKKIPLLGASFDRFDSYGDVEDVAIKDVGTAEKWLTLPLVLDRLDKVSRQLGGSELWNLAKLDRNFDGQALDLMLPSRVDGYRFHLELLNDIVNPRGGHSVAADTFAQAIKKAIALRKANVPGNDNRGPNRSYYFISTKSKRGVNVVLKGTTDVLTVFYSGAATRWSTTTLSAELRLERTVA